MLLVAVAGLAAGAIHVLAGPDHLAALAPLVADRRRRAWRAGARWGLGHAAGVLLVGAVALALRGWLPVERLSGWGERLVGVVLIGIGWWGLRRAAGMSVHAHAHDHDGGRHVHLHVHAPGRVHDEPAHAGHPHAAFAVGVVHGCAGGSHVFGILPALALPAVAASAAYLLAFGAGTVAAMGAFAAAVGFAARRFAPAGTAAARGLLGAAATAALLVGGYWLLA